MPDPQIVYVSAVTLAAMVLFVREWYAPDTVALLVIVALVVGGSLNAEEAFRAFGNEALVTVAAMFILSAGITRTGAVGFIGRRLVALGGKGEVRLLLALMAAAAACSAVINNTPVAVIFLPLVLGVADATGIKGSKLLIPMSYATIVGGMCTVLGTSTNILVSSLLPRFDHASLPLFTPLPLALVGAAMTFAYMATIGRRLLPDRPTVSSSMGTASGPAEYVSEVRVPEGSPLVGSPIQDAFTGRPPTVRVLRLVRDGRVHPMRGGAQRLEAGDDLLVRGEVNALLALERRPDVVVAPELAPAEPEGKPGDRMVAELILRPASAAAGERVGDLALPDRHGVSVLAVQRHDVHIREKVSEVRLRFGDVLLIAAPPSALPGLRTSPDFIVLEAIQEHVRLPHKAWAALTIVGLVVITASLGLLPISLLALGGAMAMVATGCLTTRAAYRALDLPILVLIAGTIALGVAMESSGAARWIAGGLVSTAAPLGDLALLATIYLVANVLTALVSNAGAALIVLPIALETARQAGLAPLPFIIAVMFAASIDFSTPIGYQTNTLVYGPGGYRFVDYVRVGGPLNVLWWILATLLIPVFWPLR